MSIEAKLGILAVAAYFVGAIPFGLLVGLAKGVDPRRHASGNIGATNVGRLLGKKYFALVFLLDLLKGAVPMLVASWLVAGLAHPPYLMWMLVGAGSILGHLYPIYLKFKGGKGVATSAGVLLGLFPYYTIPGFGALIVYLIAWRATRTVSVGSILGALSFPLCYLVVGLLRGWGVFGPQLPLLIFAVVMALLIVWKHRSNIRRLLQGTEHNARQAPGEPTRTDPATPEPTASTTLEPTPEPSPAPTPEPTPAGPSHPAH